jgi:hypothetical protein
MLEINVLGIELGSESDLIEILLMMLDTICLDMLSCIMLTSKNTRALHRKIIESYTKLSVFSYIFSYS